MPNVATEKYIPKYQAGPNKNTNVLFNIKMSCAVYIFLGCI